MPESLYNKADSTISIASFYIFFYNFSRVTDRSSIMIHSKQTRGRSCSLVRKLIHHQIKERKTLNLEIFFAN